jgi:hypothetical protein
MGPGLTIRTATLGWSPLCLLPNSTRGQGSSPLSWRGMWLSTKIPYPFGIEDWQRIFGGFTFLRNFSYTPLWFIGKNRKYSIRLYSFGLISQERKQEVWSLGKKNPSGKLPPCVRVIGFQSLVSFGGKGGHASKSCSNSELRASILYFSYSATKGHLISFPVFSILIGLDLHAHSIPTKFLFLCFPYHVFQRGCCSLGWAAPSKGSQYIDILPHKSWTGSHIGL